MTHINREKFRMNYININHLVRLYDGTGEGAKRLTLLTRNW